MLNKKDPLIDAIQQVMQSNQVDRDAVKAINEKFGIQDRRVLPRERQGEWDAAYQTVLSEGVEALDEKSFAALAPPYDKATHKDKLVGAGVLKKHPTEPGKHVLAKEEKKMKGDDPCWDNYEMIGMKKGKGGKEVPNCVPVKEQMTNPSKLKNMIMNIKEAKKAAMYEDTLEEKAAAGFVQAMQKKAAAAASPVKTQRQASGDVAPQRQNLNKRELGVTAVQNMNKGREAPKPNSTANGNQFRPAPGTIGDKINKAGRVPPSISSSNTPSAAAAARPAVGGARPGVVAKNSMTRRGMGYTPASGSEARTGGNPTAKPAAKAPVPKPKPAGGAVAKPVRKQPTTGTAKPAGGGVTAKPVNKSNVLGRVKAIRQRDKNNNVGPGN